MKFHIFLFPYFSWFKQIPNSSFTCPDSWTNPSASYISFYQLLRLHIFCNIGTFEINEWSTIWRLSQGRSVLTVNFFKSCAVHAPIWAVLGCTCHGLRWFSMYPIFSLISFGIFRHLFPYGPSQVLDIKVGKGQISENNQVIKMLKLPWFFSHTMFYLHDSWKTKATYQFASV